VSSLGMLGERDIGKEEEREGERDKDKWIGRV
jgi:hypothetical protein